jgi:hypothetical protein
LTAAGRRRTKRIINREEDMSDDYIDIDALDKFFEENPIHLTPEQILLEALDMLEGKRGPYEALQLDVEHLLCEWEVAGTPPTDVRHFEVDALLLRHGFASPLAEAKRTRS